MRYSRLSRSGQITLGNVDHIHTRILAEVANGPITPDAGAVSHGRGLLVVPDIHANSSGVSHSGIANAGLNSLVVL